jgi:2-polyprenyl-6-methoxyphenol hydroxylase-like FAD-dependent oxidoreductase
MRVAVVGGGIGGCTAALALQKAGADVTVYEQASELREAGYGIQLQPMAIPALAGLGVSYEMLNSPDSADGICTSTQEFYTRHGHFVSEGFPVPGSRFTMRRSKLHATLVKECMRHLGEDKFVLDSMFAYLEQSEEKVVLHQTRRSTGEELPPIEYDFLVGCDGLKSRVRASLLGDDLPRFSGSVAYRGVCEVPSLVGDGKQVSVYGNQGNPGLFLCYPVSEACRQKGATLCNWVYLAHRAEPRGIEDWTSIVSVEDIRADLESFERIFLGGLTPLQMAERSNSIIGFSLFDRKPLDSFDFRRVTLLGDAAHPMLPFGGQGATQAIVDAEALGICFTKALAAGIGVRGAVQAYSFLRCEATGKVVLSSSAGPAQVLQVVEEKCQGMSSEDKAAWIKEHGAAVYAEIIASYRNSMAAGMSQQVKHKAAEETCTNLSSLQVVQGRRKIGSVA